MRWLASWRPACRTIAMARSRLSGKVGAALDPCGAIQVPFELADGQERTIVFRLGVGRTAADAAGLVERFRGRSAAQGALEAVEAHWQRTLGAVQVDLDHPTPIYLDGQRLDPARKLSIRVEPDALLCVV